MSRVPSSGQLDYAGLIREFLSRRGSVDYTNGDAYTIAGRNGNGYGGYFPISYAYGGFRHYYTSGGYAGLRGGYSPTTGTPSGFTNFYDGFADDTYVAVNLPFPMKISGVDYYTAYVGSNGYITFGGGSTTFSGLSWSNPNLAKIFYGGGDRNFTYVGVQYHTGYSDTTGNLSVTIRIEGSYPYTINQGRGQANSITEVILINGENCVDGTNFKGYGIANGPWTDNSGLNLYGIANTVSPLLPYSGNQAYQNWAPYGYPAGYDWNQSTQPGNYWRPDPDGSG